MATPTDDTVPLTGNSFIDGLTWGASWVFPGPQHVLTYSFSYWDSPYTAGTWTPAWKSAVAQAFQTWANVANVKFVESGSGTLLSHSPADIGIGLTWELGVYLGAASLAFPPSPSFVNGSGIRPIFARAEGDIWFDHTFPPFSSFQLGKMGFEIVIHEIGHALGLKHSFDNDGGSRPTFTELGISQYENQDWTVMSYTHGTGYDDNLSHVITPMVLDILAIQHIYGPNMTYHTGNDVYALTDRGVKQAIWDAGGIDTIDASRLPTGIEIDLHAGSLMHYGIHAGHIAIAYNVTIENAIGTLFHDHLIGNDTDNLLQGNGGADYLAGGLGDDSYVTDGLDDIFERPGEGTDTVRGAVFIQLGPDLENAVLVGTANLEALGNALENRLTGNAGSNHLDGGAGADTMIGLAGNDRYIVDNAGDSPIEQAGQGNDTVESYLSYSLGPNVEALKLLGADNINGTGNELDNLLSGNAGANILAGGPGNDTYDEIDSSDTIVEAPSAGVDTVRSYFDYALGDNIENLELFGSAVNAVGNQLSNSLIGHGGTNRLDGARGADQMIGGAGNDTYQVDFGLDQVNELAGQGVDTIDSQVPQVLAVNVENLTLADSAGNIEGIGNAADNLILGNNAANLLDGGAGRDTLKGQSGDDTLLGGGGDDTLDGGNGRDVLVGGTGGDQFLFASPISNGVNFDRIADFVNGQDVIDLLETIFTGMPRGVLAPSDFVNGPGALAQDASDHVIHDTNTGMLYYDADGSGLQEMIPFAQVNPGQVLAATDFHVVA